jgi:hypothetical protein
MAVLITAGLNLAGFFPPPSPSLDADGTAELFAQSPNRIRFGAILLMFAAVLYWPFSVAIAIQMRRIEGPSHPLASTQLLTASGTAIAIMLPSFLWLAAAYRLSTPAEIVQVLNDIAWLMFLGAIPPALIQVLAIAACVLLHPKQRVFPRWFGYFNLWAATGFLVGEAIFFFQAGPFAWNGLVSFWLAATVFFTWTVVCWYQLYCAVTARRSDSEMT